MISRRGFTNRRTPILVWMLGYITVAIIFTLFSAMPWMFVYLEIGKLVGPIVGLQYFILILFAVGISLISFKVSMKLKRKWVIQASANLMISLAISFLTIFSFSAIYMPQVAQAGGKIDAFITENIGLSFQDYVNAVSRFLDENVGVAYGKPEASFKIDVFLSNTLLDPYIMQVYGVTRVDLIVYQRWGTCEQAAILIAKLLQRAGYETRQAFFKNIDHQWAEVKYNGTWLIVDPWYIGTLIEAQNLKNLKPQFQLASGVEVQYPNGTMVDASREHGY
ncbi:transglutaminase domain-containing protein [Candidatus Bathyarchaeota archaeon]|nr:transglutaminase domain-containing protein [Candidatus Bathyarchaeota archaeon]